MDRAFKHYLNCLFTVPPPPSYNMWGWGEGDSHTSMFCCNITVLQCRSFQHSLHRFQGPSYSNIARIMNAANVFVFVIVFVIVPQL